MGAGGAGFAQGFANTLLTLGPQIEARQREREQLEIQNKLANASLKLHEAQSEALTRKLQTEQGLRELLTMGVPQAGMTSPEFAPGAPAVMGRQPFDVANPQHRSLLMAIDPEFRKEDLKTQMRTQSTRGLAQEFGFGGGAPAMTAQPSPAVPSAPVVPAGGAIPLAVEGGRMVPKRSMTIGADGTATFSINNEIVKYDVKSGTMRNDDGTEQLISYAADPLTGQPVTGPDGKPIITPIGPLMPSKELLEIRDQLKGFGVDPNSAAAAPVLAQLQRAKLIGDTKARDAFLEQIEAQVSALPDAVKKAPKKGTPQPMAQETPAVAPSIGGARKTAAERERTDAVLTEAAKTTAKIRAELQNKPLEGKALDKFQALETLQRKGGRALEIMRPEYLGKPFLDKFKGEFAKVDPMKGYTPGALAGALRSAMGDATPDEVEFRTMLTEMADDILRARSQGSTTEAEFSRMKGFMANLMDEPTTFKAAMSRIIKESTVQMESVKRAATTSAADLPTRPTAPGTSDAARKGAGGTLRRNKSGMLEYEPGGAK